MKFLKKLGKSDKIRNIKLVTTEKNKKLFGIRTKLSCNNVYE